MSFLRLAGFALLGLSLPLYAPPVPEYFAPVLPLVGIGIASFYGVHFHGRLTASGEPFDRMALTAAHRILPFGSLVKVVLDTGAAVIVRITDRGPAAWTGREIDLSEAAAEHLGMTQRGVAPCSLYLVGAAR